jgi:hypothetical protein
VTSRLGTGKLITFFYSVYTSHRYMQRRCVIKNDLGVTVAQVHNNFFPYIVAVFTFRKQDSSIFFEIEQGFLVTLSSCFGANMFKIKIPLEQKITVKNDSSDGRLHLVGLREEVYVRTNSNVVFVLFQKYKKS